MKGWFLNRVWILVVAVFSTLCCVPSGAQVSDVVFENFSMGDGLSHNTITCVFQDSRGYIWIGTPSGLNRYDGRVIKEYKNIPLDSRSISNNRINAICEDASGNIWIATEFGLNRLDRLTGEFDIFTHDESKESTISNNIVYNVYCDKSGKIWVKTIKNLDVFNPKTRKFKHYEHFFDIFNPLPENPNFPIFEDSQGLLWVGSNDGLLMFDKQYEQFYRYESEPSNELTLSNNQIKCLFEDSKGQLWVGTSLGLNKYNRKDKTFERFKFSQSNTQDPINAIVEDYNYNLWLASGELGLVKMDPTRKAYTYFKQNINSSKSIANNNIYCLLKDKSEVIWIGTRSGLSKLDSKKKKFNLYCNTQESLFKLSGNDVTCILADQNEEIFVGTRNDGITKLNRLKKSAQFYSYEKGTNIDNHTHCIYRSRNKEILAGTDRGVAFFNDKTNKFEAYAKLLKAKGYQRIAGKKISVLFQDSQRNLWMGSNQGLFKHSPANDSISVFFHKNDDNSTISSNEITSIVETRTGEIWVGTDAGLNRYEPTVDIFERKMYEKNSNQGLSHNMVYCLIIDDNDLLWIGTASGLNKYDPSRGGVFTYYTEKDGLPNNQVFHIIKDGGDLWFSTNKGIARYTINTGDVRSYNIADGLQGFEFNPSSGCISPRGELFFGGVSGFNSFFPKSIHDNQIIPNIEITSIVVYGNLGKQIIIPYGEKQIKLSSDSRTFTIEFAAMEFTQPNHNKYMYYMEGLENKWIDLESRNFVNFTNIPSGEYTFIVKGSNSDEVWNETGVSVNITIETPIWKNKWAYLVYLFMVGSVLYLYIEVRTNRLRKANRVLREKELAAIEIAKQKEELAMKNKNIMDSITYAQRIQLAIMPSISKFKRLIPESFILYKPKDIVSGDFYWITEIGDKIFIAAVDCTGHGVPGAFMSIIGYDLLRNITKERGIHRPSEVLDQLNKSLIELLTKNNVAVGDVKDGMDISLCVFHKSKGVLEFSSALNPLYLIRDEQIITIKGDRFSVGLGNEHPDENFKNNNIKLQTGDRMYVFSDGYADQFGGPTGKKMKFRRFRHLLLSIHKTPFEEQRKYLDEHFDHWRGQLEQVDDLLIIGMNFDYYLEQLSMDEENSITQ